MVRDQEYVTPPPQAGEQLSRLERPAGFFGALLGAGVLALAGGGAAETTKGYN